MTLLAVSRAVMLLLAMQVALAAVRVAAAAERATTYAPPTATRTVKERLASKASDDQRINNCKVPLELRGPEPRPDACRAHSRTPPPR